MIIIINFKDYKESIGKNAIKLAKSLDHQGVWLVVNAIDLKEVIRNVKYSKIFIENVDPVELGAYTGSISFPEVKKSKAFGVLINHSENRIKFDKIKRCIKLAKKYKLKIIVSSNSLSEELKINKLNPDFTAIEPPELISTKNSISMKKPDLIKRAGLKIKNLVVGAGINTAEDIKIANEFGARGVLISSAIVKSKNPKNKLNDLVRFKY